MVVACAFMDHSRRHRTLQFTFMSHRSKLVCVVENLRKWCPVFRYFSSRPTAMFIVPRLVSKPTTTSAPALRTSYPQLSSEINGLMSEPHASSSDLREAMLSSSLSSPGRVASSSARAAFHKEQGLPTDFKQQGAPQLWIPVLHLPTACGAALPIRRRPWSPSLAAT